MNIETYDLDSEAEANINYLDIDVGVVYKGDMADLFEAYELDPHENGFSKFSHVFCKNKKIAEEVIDKTGATIVKNDEVTGMVTLFFSGEPYQIIEAFES